MTDPRAINPALGGQAAFDALAAALGERGLGLLLDIVPNHMAASPQNPWWYDVLQFGPRSPYAAFFDVDWRPAGAALQDRVLLPILGAPYRKTLYRGELRLAIDDDGLCVRYYDWRLPLSPASLQGWLAGLPVALMRHLPSGSAGEIAALAEQTERLADEARDALAALQRALGRLYGEQPAARAYLDARLAAWNGRPGAPRSFARLERLLSQQAYRLAYWRLASRALNYRRFFDIADLVALRIETPRAFEAVHAHLGRLLAAWQVSGLRIDHVDGLQDPLGYLQRLQRWAAAVAAPAEAGSLTDRSQPLYVVVEKILTGDETLPDDWPVAGTTGYEFAALATNLLVDASGLDALDAVYREAGGMALDYAAIAEQQKTYVMDTLFAGERRALARQLGRLAQNVDRATCFPLADLERAVTAVTARLPVYRTYTRGEAVSTRDRVYIEAAVAAARKTTPGPPLALLRRVLLLDYPPALPTGQRRAWQRFVRRWQQFTGPVTAKGLEDSAFYRYHRLIALNEVGGEPSSHGVSVDAFHAAMQRRRQRWPHTLNATSTHDTKRSEDVRARIVVLSEQPTAWAERLRQWQAWNAPLKPVVRGQAVPDANTEIMLYQTLLGAWPLDDAELPAFRERVQGFALKAAREARVATSWLDPDQAWEEAQAAWLRAILDPQQSGRFLADFLPFQRRLAYFGALNALSQLLLKLAVPGVPDVYQGTELWDFSLVDPDNRRPVDYPRRQRLLAALDAAAASPATIVPELLARWADGRVKLWLLSRLLRLRRDLPELFARGDYLPLPVEGAAAPHVCAFARRWSERWLVVVAPRLYARLAATAGQERLWEGAAGLALSRALWRDTALTLPADAPLRWQWPLTGGALEWPGPRLDVGLALGPLGAGDATFPVGLLLGVAERALLPRDVV